jgi:HSP20 family protein
MSITRWDPWGDIVSLREAMNNLLEESFVRSRHGMSRPGMASSLALDVKEMPDQFTVTASVPGVPLSDIDISVLGDTLRIRGHRQEATEERGEGGRWLLRERRYGAFERTVSLPTTVDAERAAADFTDGVLTITLPKAEIAKPKTIAVSGRAAAQPAASEPIPTDVPITQDQGAGSEEALSARYAMRMPTNAVRGDGTTTCPAGYPVKGNTDSGIYHTPDSPSYGQTIAEFCFASASAAEAAGFQPAG